MTNKVRCKLYSNNGISLIVLYSNISNHQLENHSISEDAKNGQEIKQEVVQDDEVDHDGVEVINFEEDEENEEKIIFPKMAPPTGLGGWTGNNAIESHEKLGSGQFVNNYFIFFNFLTCFHQ